MGWVRGMSHKLSLSDRLQCARSVQRIINSCALHSLTSFGYFITTGRVAWMLMVVLSEVWNGLRKRLCRPTKERNLSDSLNAPLNDATDASGTQRM
eukprot:COSAG03_NODE_1112_length_4789_cov_4.025800_3_plen_96_part_00